MVKNMDFYPRLPQIISKCTDAINIFLHERPHNVSDMKFLYGICLKSGNDNNIG